MGEEYFYVSVQLSKITIKIFVYLADVNNFCVELSAVETCSLDHEYKKGIV